MTGKEFADYIRYMTRTNTTTLPDADIVLLGNLRLESIAKSLLGVGEDTLILPMFTNLLAEPVPGLGGNREYPFDKSVLSRIKRVEAKFDGTNWVKLDEFDLGQIDWTTDEATILQHFSNQEGEAKYDISRKSLWIYSGTITAVASGLKLWTNTYPAKLDASKLNDAVTDLSQDPTPTTQGFPRELHNVWAKGVCIDYKQSREKPIPLNEQEIRYDVDLAEAVVALRTGNLDRRVYASIPPASDRGNNGADY